MKEEIMTRNSLTTSEIDTLMKLPKSRTMKITFKKTQVAKKTTEEGLLMFAMRIPSHQVKQAKFHNI